MRASTLYREKNTFFQKFKLTKNSVKSFYYSTSVNVNILESNNKIQFNDEWNSAKLTKCFSKIDKQIIDNDINARLIFKLNNSIASGELSERIIQTLKSERERFNSMNIMLSDRNIMRLIYFYNITSSKTYKHLNLLLPMSIIF